MVVRYAVAAVVAGLVVTLVGCGGAGSTSASARLDPSRGERVSKRPCRRFGPKQRHAEARLVRDVRALRRASNTPPRDTFKGNIPVNNATDRFLLDEETAPLDHYTRNRYINLAAAAVTPVCQQCFQALEANRPIVNLGMNEAGALPCPAKH
jgi:hypothetical protein